MRQGGIQAFLVDDCPNLDILVETVADLHLGRLLAEALEKLLVDGALYVDAVCCNAGLAVVSELGNQGAVDRLLDIGIFEDDDRRMPAELEGELRDGPCGLLEELLSHFGGAGEGDLAEIRVVHELTDDLARRAGNELEDALWNTDLVETLRECHVTERGLRCRAEDHGAARGEGGGDLADGQDQREVPRRDTRYGTHRLLEHEVTFAVGLMRDNAAVAAPRFFGEPAQVVYCDVHLAEALAEGLAVLPYDRLADLFLAALQALGYRQEIVCPLHAGETAPAFEGCPCIVYGFLCFLGSGGGHTGHGLAVSGVDDVE